MRDPGSEISRFEAAGAGSVSSDLKNVLDAYAFWQRRTNGILSLYPNGPGSPRNVDALGKAYILDRAAHAGAQASSHIDGILLNIGGDMVTWGRAVEVTVADPASPYDNAPPRTRLLVKDCALATTGSYARGAHLLDPRSGKPVVSNAAATVVARDAVTANAIATSMCAGGEDSGFSLAARHNAQALYIAGARERRTPGFAGLERPPALTRISTAANWPAGYQMTLALTLTEGGGGRFGGRGGFGGRGSRGGRGGQRPYVAVWIENSAGKIVRVLAFWASKARYFSELSRFYSATGRDQNYLYSVARATRSPGKYDLVWDGFDEKHNPVPLGTYRVIVETNQEHGSYAKQESTIACGGAPATMTLSATSNFEAVPVEYGPKANQA